MTVKTLLCFDYGTKRIGVAIGQTLTASARPLCIVKSSRTQADWTHISKLIETWQPGQLIVGRPLTMHDETQEMTAAAERFAKQLHGRYHLPVALTDERLSSFAARCQLRRTHDIDAVAAQYILETWLAEQLEVTGSRSATI